LTSEVRLVHYSKRRKEKLVDKYIIFKVEEDGTAVWCTVRPGDGPERALLDVVVGERGICGAGRYGKYFVVKQQEDGVHGEVTNPGGGQAVFEVTRPTVHPQFTVRPATL
jgi:hypothetical protein